MNRVFGLLGSGGFGREVLEFLPEVLSGEADPVTIYAVERSPEVSQVNGFPCISDDDFMALSADRAEFNVASADSRLRERLMRQMMAAGATPRSIIHPTAILSPTSRIGPGAVFCAFSMVTAGSQIGRMFQCNYYSYVAHDCVIGDFVTFAPNVSCSGNVHIHDHAYIGAGAVIKQGRPGDPLIIGEGAVVGMGAVVTKDVPPGTTVVGNPARPLTR